MNRGGNRGQGQGLGRGGEKRKPNTPVGGQYKDQRRGLNSDDMEYEEEEDGPWTEVSYRRSPPQQNQQPPSETSDSVQGRPTFASVAAQQASSSLQNRRNSTASANFNQKKVSFSKSFNLMNFSSSGIRFLLVTSFCVTLINFLPLIKPVSQIFDEGRILS